MKELRGGMYGIQTDLEESIAEFESLVWLRSQPKRKWVNLFEKLKKQTTTKQALEITKFEVQMAPIIESYEAPQKVSTKKHMYELLSVELLGNRQVIFDIGDAEEWFNERVYTYFSNGLELTPRKVSYHACQNPPKHHLWALRYKEPGYRQWSCYDLPPENVWPTYCDYVAEGADPDKFNLTPMMPDDKIVLQGEISYINGELNLRVSEEQRPMNISLAGNFVHHLRNEGRMLLKSIMTTNDYEDLFELLERYPTAVIEFSVYSCNVGSLPNRRTIIWEVRDY